MATLGLSVWVVDDDESVRWVLEQALKQANMIPRCFDSGEAFFNALDLEKPDVLVTDIRMPGMSGLQLMDRLAERDPDLPGHRHHGPFRPGQRRVRLSERRIRVLAETLRHR